MDINRFLQNFGLALYGASKPTDYVIHLKSGKQVAEGMGITVRFGLNSKISVIPSDVKKIPFTPTFMTADKQRVVVKGEIIGKFMNSAGELYDFSVNPFTGEPNGDGLKALTEMNRTMTQSLLKPIVLKEKIEELPQKEAAIQGELYKKIDEIASSYTEAGFDFQTCLISVIAIENSELSNAFGAQEREEKLAGADKARADRRVSAIKDEERIAEANKTLEEKKIENQMAIAAKNKELIEKEGDNQVKKAGFDQQALEKQLEPYKNLNAATVLSLAIQKAA